MPPSGATPSDGPGAPGAAAPRPEPTAETTPAAPPPSDAPADDQPSATDQDAGANDVPEEAGEVDRVLLAQEFSRLLQEPGLDDEA